MLTYNAWDLEDLSGTKESCFNGYDESFDYSLPQDWLNQFSDWCKKYRPKVTYQIILSTVVWAYPEGSCMGQPVTCCHQVAEAFKAMTLY